MNLNSISKDKILSHTNCSDIYISFLGLNEFPKRNISSPFSKDEKPSFRIFNNGTFKCNSTGKQGDVWQFVAYLKDLDCKTQFTEVLKIIANQMNITLQDNTNIALQGNTNNIEKNTKTNKKSTDKDIITLQVDCNVNDQPIASNNIPSKLDIEKRDFTELDLKYWSNLGVNEKILEKYNVHSIASYTWTNKKPIYTKKEAVAFAFELEKQYKLYIPNQPEIGIKKNVLPPFENGIFGLEQLGSEKKETLIICAGEKDTIVARSRGFNAITFGSEAKHPKENDIKLLQGLCKHLFVCFDNDKTGENGRNALIKRFPEIIALQLPVNENIKGYDITDYFQEHSTEDFIKIIDLAVKNKSVVEPTEETQITTIIHITENYLNENYNIRHNIIANEVEITKKNINYWEPCNENSLWIEMQKKGIKVPCSTLEKLLKSDFIPKYNPLLDYFEKLPDWDRKTDYIKQYSEYITLAIEEDKNQFEYHFKKWCVRSVKCAIDDRYFNKNAFVLSDDGKGQNIGKTTWIRNLCPAVLSNYITDNLPKDEKDAKIVLTRNFIINLDELASLTKQEINTLKSLFSVDKIKTRFPYDKKETVVSRVGNFIGSTNMSTFLQDETGSVRWLCFIADKIDFSYKENFNMDNLWSQAYHLSKDKNFDEKITAEDIKINEVRNDKFQIQTPEKDLISKYFEVPKNNNEIEYLSATDIQSYISSWSGNFSIRLTSVGIGRALKALKFQQGTRTSKSGQWAVKKKDLGIS